MSNEDSSSSSSSKRGDDSLDLVEPKNESIHNSKHPEDDDDSSDAMKSDSGDDSEKEDKASTKKTKKGKNKNKEDDDDDDDDDDSDYEEEEEEEESDDSDYSVGDDVSQVWKKKKKGKGADSFDAELSVFEENASTTFSNNNEFGGMSQYERERLSRITSNRAVFDRLGVSELSAIAPPKKDTASATTTTTTATARRHRKFQAPTRCSARLANEAVTYLELPEKYHEYTSRRHYHRGHVRARNDYDSETFTYGIEKYTMEQYKSLGTCKKEYDWLAMTPKKYDSVNGVTCHQCRQKTLDKKTTCTKCKCLRGSFCGMCLQIRYGENLDEVLAKIRSGEGWECPSCRGYCNCSFCRIKRGLGPTGIMYPKIEGKAKSVAHYLVHRFLVDSKGRYVNKDKYDSAGNFHPEWGKSKTEGNSDDDDDDDDNGNDYDNDDDDNDSDNGESKCKVISASNEDGGSGWQEMEMSVIKNSLEDNNNDDDGINKVNEGQDKSDNEADKKDNNNNNVDDDDDGGSGGSSNTANVYSSGGDDAPDSDDDIIDIVMPKSNSASSKTRKGGSASQNNTLGIKRKKGRPKGSKNKKKKITVQESTASTTANANATAAAAAPLAGKQGRGRGRGRGRGSKKDSKSNKSETDNENNESEEEEEEYEVESILDERVVSGVRYFMVKWKGYKETTWEPQENCVGCERKINEFYKSQDYKQ